MHGRLQRTSPAAADSSPLAAAADDDNDDNDSEAVQLFANKSAADDLRSVPVRVIALAIRALEQLSPACLTLYAAISCPKCQ
jgi:hypothetical protein